MTTRRPLITTGGVFFICATAVLITIIVLDHGVGDDDVEVIAKTCQSQGMVARLDVQNGHTLVYCQKPDEAGGFDRPKK